MKLVNISLSAIKRLTVLTILSMLPVTSQAAAILTLSGETDQVKYKNASEVRMSVINWSMDNQRVAVEQAWRQYNMDNDLETFMQVVEEQDTRGYLFTSEATGYGIKYAWQEETENGQMMHFLVTPGLKTKNNYIWHVPNNDSPEFTFVQVLLDSETGIAKTSLDGDIALNEQGKLVLDRFEAINQFATMKDSTPYYLR